MKTALVTRVVTGAVLGFVMLGCAPPSTAIDDRAGLIMVDDVPELFFLACPGETVESVEVWFNADGDRVVIEPDDDEMLWSTDTPGFEVDGRFADVIDLPDGWWLDDTQIEIETSEGKSVVIVTGIETLEPETLWSNSVGIAFDEYERRAVDSC
jgi:hypothetical protein